MKVKVGNREIGDGCPPYIIAEVGSNWRNLDDCLESIVQAKHAGADAVKFQLFSPNDLYGPGLMQWDNIKWVNDSEFFIKYESPYLDPMWLLPLKKKADRVGIDFMCAAFSPDGYDLVNQYVDIHKVASSECCHLRILQKLRQLGKPVILSTGAKCVEDIKMALEILNTDWSMTCKWDGDPKTRAFDKPPVILMYCVVAYPASGVDLYQINNLKQIFDIQVGYSDHSTDIETIPPVSFSHGSCLIEKHFTIIPCVATPDQPHSLNPDQFKRMSFCIRNRKYPPIHSYGWHSEFKGSTPEEKTALLRYSRRLIAIKDLHPGDTLTEGVNFGIYRSLVDDTRAAHPFMIDQFIGRTVKRELKAGQGLWFEDINT